MVLVSKRGVIGTLHIPNLFFLLVLSVAISSIERLAAASLLVDTSGLDPVSAGCYSCHDGSNGPLAIYSFPSQKGRGSGGHLISASYIEMASANRTLRPISSLPPELVFYEGEITCATCHGSDPHHGETLVIANSRSALCKACHLY